jgi:uncharacterized protein YjiS (DUF1127 family)
MASSAIEVRASPAAGQGLAGFWQIARVIRQLIVWTRSERRIRGGIDELRALDDHLLADLGLNRGHIEYVAYASRYGRLPKGWNDGLCR